MAMHPVYVPGHPGVDPVEHTSGAPGLLEIAHDPTSPWDMRVRIVLAETDLAADLVVQTEGATPRLNHGQSWSILGSLRAAEYLAELSPKTMLAPRTPQERALMWRFDRFAAERLAPALATLELAESHDGPRSLATARDHLVSALTALSQMLPSSGYILGRFSLADVTILPFLTGIAAFTPRVLHLPYRVARYVALAMKRPSIAGDPRIGGPAGRPDVLVPQFSAALAAVDVEHLPRVCLKDGKLFAGSTPEGPVLYAIADDSVYEGETTAGSPVATVHEGAVFAGRTPIGSPIAYVAAGALFAPGTMDVPVATLDGATDGEAAALAYLYLGIEPSFSWPNSAA